jgi:hypothetical protein
MRHGTQVGIEAKIEYHPALEILGIKYESWRRTALNWLQTALTEDEVEKRLQKEFNSVSKKSLILTGHGRTLSLQKPHNALNS